MHWRDITSDQTCFNITIKRISLSLDKSQQYQCSHLSPCPCPPQILLVECPLLRNQKILLQLSFFLEPDKFQMMMKMFRHWRDLFPVCCVSPEVVTDLVVTGWWSPDGGGAPGSPGSLVTSHHLMSVAILSFIISCHQIIPESRYQDHNDVLSAQIILLSSHC